MPLSRDCWAHSLRKDSQLILTHAHTQHTQHLQRNQEKIQISQSSDETGRNFNILILVSSHHSRFLFGFTQKLSLRGESRTEPLSHRGVGTEPTHRLSLDSDHFFLYVAPNSYQSGVSYKC